MLRPRLSAAFVASAVLHGALLLLSVRSPGARAETTGDKVDAWAGDTVDVEVVETQRDRPLAAGAEAPAPVPAAPAVPTMPAAPRPASAAPTAAPRPAPASALRPAPSPPDDATPAPQAPAPTAPAGTAQDVEPAPSPAASPVAAAGPTAAAPAGARATGTFGAVGVGGERELGRAFTRALPAAALAEDGWLRLAEGTASSVRVTLSLDEQGGLASVTLAEPPPPRYLARLLRRVEHLLERGKFAIAARPGAVSETYLLTVEVVDGAPDEDPFAEATHIMRRGFEAPEPGVPGRATFAFASGREIVLHVALAPPP